ncbi:MAG: hypothetical protein H5T32_07700 [Candidatus Methanosuratus sp.]|nr:hypothetical protein [Candidatus Methanosuratincola sp.]
MASRKGSKLKRNPDDAGRHVMEAEDKMLVEAETEEDGKGIKWMRVVLKMEKNEGRMPQK